MSFTFYKMQQGETGTVEQSKLMLDDLMEKSLFNFEKEGTCSLNGFIPVLDGEEFADQLVIDFNEGKYQALRYRIDEKTPVNDKAIEAEFLERTTKLDELEEKYNSAKILSEIREEAVRLASVKTTKILIFLDWERGYIFINNTNAGKTDAVISKVLDYLEANTLPEDDEEAMASFDLDGQIDTKLIKFEKVEPIEKIFTLWATQPETRPNGLYFDDYVKVGYLSPSDAKTSADVIHSTNLSSQDSTVQSWLTDEDDQMYLKGFAFIYKDISGKLNANGGVSSIKFKGTLSDDTCDDDTTLDSQFRTLWFLRVKALADFAYEVLAKAAIDAALNQKEREEEDVAED